MRWAGHVARMGQGRGVHRVLVGRPEGKRPLERPRRRWRIILRWIFRKWEGVVRTGWSGIVPSVRPIPSEFYSQDFQSHLLTRNEL